MKYTNTTELRRCLANDIHPAIHALASHREFQINDEDFDFFRKTLERQGTPGTDDLIVFLCLTHPDSDSHHPSIQEHDAKKKAAFVVPDLSPLHQKLHQVHWANWIQNILLILLLLLLLVGKAHAQSPNEAIVVSACGTQPTNYPSTGRAPLTVDVHGNVCSSTIFSGSAANAAAGLTGSAVPTSADYQGVNISGNLVGVTGLSLQNAKAEAVAVVDSNGNQITTFGNTVDAVGSSTALNGNGVVASVAVAGQQSAVVNFTSGSCVCTVIPVISTDGGNTFITAAGYADPVAGTFLGTSTTNPSSGSAGPYNIMWFGSATHAGVKVSNYTSGSISATVRAVATKPFSIMVGQDVSGIFRPLPSMDNTARAGYQIITDGLNGHTMPTGDAAARSIHVTPDTVTASGQNAASPASEIVIAGQYNTAPTPMTSGNVSPLQVDQQANLLVDVQKTVGGTATSNINTINGLPINLGPATMNNAFPVTIAWNQSPIAVSGSVRLIGSAGLSYDDGNGNVKVAVVSGSVGNAAAGNTGSGVPSQADYQGVNVGGTLRGQTGVNPSGSVYAGQMDLASVGGTTFSLGQQAAASSLPTVAPVITFAAQPNLQTGGTETDFPISPHGALLTAVGADGFPVTQAPGYWFTSLSAVGGLPLTLGPSPMASALPVTIAWNQTPLPMTGYVRLIGTAGVAMDDGNGNVKVNVVSGSTGNAAAGNTGSMVPAQASYCGINVSGTLRGCTGVNPTDSMYNQQIDVASLNGTQLGAPSNYGTSPGAVNVLGVNAFVTNTVTVSGTVTANQGGSNWSVNTAQFGGTNVVTGTGAGGAGIPRVTVSNDSNVLSTQSGNWTVRNVGNAGAVFDAAGQNVTAPANWLSVGCNFNTSPTTISSGSGSPIGCDNADNVNIDEQKIAGTVRSVNTGNADAGTARDVLATNSPAIANWGQGATGAAVPSGAVYFGGQGSANLTGITVCDNWTALNQTTGTQIITGASSKKTYICAINLVTATAQNVALVAGTGTVCATSTHTIAGGTTAATGWNFAANGGLAQGSGIGVIAQAATAADNVCILQSGSGQISGSIAWTQY